MNQYSRGYYRLREKNLSNSDVSPPSSVYCRKKSYISPLHSEEFQQFYIDEPESNNDLASRVIRQRYQSVQGSTPSLANPNKNNSSMLSYENNFSIEMKNSLALEQKSSQRKERCGISVFENLYQQSKSRELRKRKKQQQYYQKYFKQPAIDRLSKEIISKKVSISREDTPLLKVDKQNSQAQKPQTKRKRRQSSIISRNRLNVNNKKNIQTNRKEKVKVNEKSKLFYEQKKIATFYRIFLVLDEDKDGYIGINNMNLQPIPRQVIKVIYPLLEELEVMDVQLDAQQFVEAINNLFKNLCVHEKNILLNFKPECSHPEPCKVESKMNKNSQRITAEMERSKMTIYQYCTAKEEAKQKHLNRCREQKVKREVEGCTFQPQVRSHIYKF